jgi:hypothetical protein
MIRLRDADIARQWQRIDRRVSRLVAAPRTSEAATTMLDALEKDLGVVVESFEPEPR